MCVPFMCRPRCPLYFEVYEQPATVHLNWLPLLPCTLLHTPQIRVASVHRYWKWELHPDGKVHDVGPTRFRLT